MRTSPAALFPYPVLFHSRAPRAAAALVAMLVQESMPLTWAKSRYMEKPVALPPATQ